MNPKRTLQPFVIIVWACVFLRVPWAGSWLVETDTNSKTAFHGGPSIWKFMIKQCGPAMLPLLGEVLGTLARSCRLESYAEPTESPWIPLTSVRRRDSPDLQWSWNKGACSPGVDSNHSFQPSFFPKTGRFPWVSGGCLERRIPERMGKVAV